MSKHKFASIVVLAGIAQGASANVPLLPDSQVTIHFKGVGEDHVLQALERVATPAGYVCSRSTVDYEPGRVPALRGKTWRRGRLMRCEIPQLGGPSVWLEASISDPGEVSIDVFYLNSSAKPYVDAVVTDFESGIISDPLIKSIEQRTWRETPGYSKIK